MKISRRGKSAASVCIAAAIPLGILQEYVAMAACVALAASLIGYELFAGGGGDAQDEAGAGGDEQGKVGRQWLGGRWIIFGVVLLVALMLMVTR